MIPDRLQYILEHLWNDQECDQIWTIGPHIYHQNISKHTRNIGTPLKIIMFINLAIWNFENIKRYMYQTVWNIGNLFSFSNFLILKLWRFETMVFDNLRFRNLNFRNWNIETLKIGKMTILFSFWKLRVHHFWSNCVKMGTGKWWRLVKQNLQKSWIWIFISIKNHEMKIW